MPACRFRTSTRANHQADDRSRTASAQAAIKLAPADSIPNKDFVLRYDVVGKKPEMAVLAHTGNYSLDAAAAGQRLLHADDPAARKTSG